MSRSEAALPRSRQRSRRPLPFFVGPGTAAIDRLFSPNFAFGSSRRQREEGGGGGWTQHIKITRDDMQGKGTPEREGKIGGGGVRAIRAPLTPRVNRRYIVSMPGVRLDPGQGEKRGREDVLQGRGGEGRGDTISDRGVCAYSRGFFRRFGGILGELSSVVLAANARAVLV